jgi:bacterioferritin
MAMSNQMHDTLASDPTEPLQLADSAAPALVADSGPVLRLLGRALAAERASRRRYEEHSEVATRALAPDVAVRLWQHADEKQLHVLQLTQRIHELGGAVEPDSVPDELRSWARPIGRAELLELIREDIVAEYILIDSCGEMRRRLGESDPISGGILEELLATGEAQGMHLIRLLRGLEPARRQRSERTLPGRRAERVDPQPRGEPR